jgi:hypothetical protein
MFTLNYVKKCNEFVELQRGDTFLHGDYVYIKTNTFRTDPDEKFNPVCIPIYNAVCITDGHFGYFQPQDKVVLVDIEATIK